MGNCQAAEAAAAAAAVIRHPGGRIERVYWSLTSGQLMASNPGHYVGVVISARPSSGQAPVRYLRLLRPDDALLAGHVHWLVSFEDVLKEFGSKKHVRLSRLLAKQKERERERERHGSERERRAQGRVFKFRGGSRRRKDP